MDLYLSASLVTCVCPVYCIQGFSVLSVSLRTIPKLVVVNCLCYPKTTALTAKRELPHPLQPRPILQLAYQDKYKNHGYYFDHCDRLQ